MFALQSDTELALQMYFKAKQSVNRSVHAAAQQINMEQLANGIYAIDETKARSIAWQYLQQNLQHYPNHKDLHSLKYRNLKGLEANLC